MRVRQQLSITLPSLFLLVVFSANLSAFTLASVPTRASLRQSRVKSERHSRASNARENQAHPTTKNPTARASSTALHVNNNAISEGGDIASPLSKLTKFADKNFFLVGMLFAVGIARLIPSLGKNGGVLRPELFIGNFGVTLIFLLSGLSLEVSEMTKAVANYKLNASIQLATFGAWPFLVGLPIKWILTNIFPNLLPLPLVDGLLILSCLPTTVNMCIMLTSAGGGNVATAICNAVISNLVGIFLTPALLFRFFGAQITLPFLDMVMKLCNKVLLPVAVGQALRATPAKDIYVKNSKAFKRLQEVVLLGIVWNAFCNAFSSGLGLEIRHTLALLVLLPSLHLASLAVLFQIFSLPCWKLGRPEVVAAVFCASQKTLAFGLPLVNTIFQGNPNLASYCAPIMFIHPLQMIVGSLLLPKILMYTGEWQNRLSEKESKT